MTTAGNLAIFKAEHHARRLLSRWNQSKYQLSYWSALVVTLTVALVTAGLITTLHSLTDQSGQAQLLLVDIKGQLNQLSVLEYVTNAKKELTSESFEQIQQARSHTQEISQKLQAIEPDALRLQQFSQLFHQYNQLVDRKFQLIAAGQMAQADALERTSVALTYNLLNDEIANLRNAYNHQKQQINQRVVVGSLLVLGTAIAMWLFWKLGQTQQLLAPAIAEQKLLHRSEERFRAIIQNASDVILLVNAEGVVDYASTSVSRVLGYSDVDLVGTHILDLVYPEDRVQMQNLFANCLMHPQVNLRDELRWQQSFGCWCYVEVISNNLLNDSNVHKVVLTIRDIGERKRTLERLHHHAFHDSLTGLPNRTLFMERLQQAVSRAKRHDKYTFAVLFLDLDRFKVVNDSLGHKSGDELLIAIARKLEACLRSDDTVARLGGDEFAILLSQVQDVNCATHVAKRILQELTVPFCISQHPVFTSTSIGIVLGNKASDWLDDILRNADLAMYHAKALGKACYQVFDATMHTAALQRLEIETDLRHAIARHEFQVHYQPIVLLETGFIAGFEALLRWQHPFHGLISPNQFIQIAEETGEIVPIGYWVLRQACRQVRAWQLQFSSIESLTISVNVSAKQLVEADFAQQVAQILSETELDAGCLKLEITESVLVENADSITVMLWQLKALGVGLYLDDFGTGYSSLSYLHRFPIDTVKIDRSFVSQIDCAGKNLEIVRAITMLSQALGINAIAEGIETQQQLVQLSKLDCKYGQGYFFFRPLDTASARHLIAQKHESLGS